MKTKFFNAHPISATACLATSILCLAHVVCAKNAAAESGDIMTNEEKSAVVAFQGANGSATGFIALFKDKPFIFTNVHVIAGIDKITVGTFAGDELKISGVAYVAKDHDIAIVPLKEIPEGCTPITILSKIGGNAINKDEIVVCGNSEGSGTILETKGSILGFGPKLVELDCPFYEGNSGSPIFHSKTRNVIGIVSHVKIVSKSSKIRDASRANSNSAVKSDVRYFGYRIDSVKNWEKAQISALRKADKALEDFERKLDIIHECFAESGVNISGRTASYKEFSDIVGSFAKDINSFSDAAYTAKERSARNMCDKLSRLCINEASKLKALKTYGTMGAQKSSQIKEFERLAEIFKQANQNKYY